MKYKSYTLNNFRNLPQMANLSEEQKRNIEIVGTLLPFKTNNYVVEQLIDWSHISDDPMFVANFPQKDMVSSEDYRKIESLYESGADSQTIKQAADEIRLRLNPHPAGQLSYNVPVFDSERLFGIQHKYRETALFFPAQGQICHAFCTFCFRWPQFAEMEDLKISSRETDLLARYVRAHPAITDVLFTGGDPLIMKSELLARYIEPLLVLDIKHLRTIRIGTRALTYWPYRFITDSDADTLLKLFRRIRQSGKHLAFMAQFNHPVELETDIVKEAISRVQETGAVIRTQSPLLRHINDSSEIWAELWRKQVSLNCIPYYMFIARDTGPQEYFRLPLFEAWEIFKKTYQSVSGICRTVRGPVMSCLPGKVHVLGVEEVWGEKVFVLQMIQGKNPDWVNRPFFAAYDENAYWFDDLKPAFGEEKFFFQEELERMLELGKVANIGV